MKPLIVRVMLTDPYLFTAVQPFVSHNNYLQIT